MEDLSAKLEKLLIEAEDCELISRLATDHDKRQLFKKLAVDLCGMAEDIQAMISTRTPEAVSHEIKDGRMVAFSKVYNQMGVERNSSKIRPRELSEARPIRRVVYVRPCCRLNLYCHDWRRCQTYPKLKRSAYCSRRCLLLSALRTRVKHCGMSEKCAKSRRICHD
jgi:hypothetical protein